MNSVSALRICVILRRCDRCMESRVRPEATAYVDPGAPEVEPEEWMCEKG